MLGAYDNQGIWHAVSFKMVKIFLVAYLIFFLIFFILEKLAKMAWKKVHGQGEPD